MGLVVLLVVLNHLPYDTKLNFMHNGHVADVTKYLVFKVHVYIYSSVTPYNQPFPNILCLSFSIYYHVKFHILSHNPMPQKRYRPL